MATPGRRSTCASLLQRCRVTIKRNQSCASDDKVISALLKGVAGLQDELDINFSRKPSLSELVVHSLDLDSDNNAYVLSCMLLELGRLYSKRGRLEEAQESLKACLNIFPRSVNGLVEMAQVKRLSASSAEQMGEVEGLLRAAVRVGQEVEAQDAGLLVSCNKECQREMEAAAEARSQLAMLLCQSAQDEEAVEHLLELDFTHRLARQILHYPLPVQPGTTSSSIQPATPSPSDNEAAKYLCAFDSTLPPALLQQLQGAFAPGSAFWQEHNYGRVGYFSYMHALERSETDSCLITQLADHLRRLLLPTFPDLSKAKFVEWWAHCRPHSCGHQLHFDSDDEGQGGIRNPIASTVTFLTGGVGGPTLVTDQELHGSLGTRGWMVHAAEGRVAAFRGPYLHGVLPGRGPTPSPSARRSTLMLAFWEDVQWRPDPDHKPGPCRPFPDPHPASPYTWPTLLRAQEGGWGMCSSGVPVAAIPVQPVWEPVALSGSKPGASPKYHECFQGF